MNRYIKLSDAIKSIDDLPDCYNGFSDAYDKSCIIGVLEELPSADVVPVVRCRDCKYSEPYDGSTKVTSYLKCLYRSRVLGNWFCEHGKKVEE